VRIKFNKWPPEGPLKMDSLASALQRRLKMQPGFSLQETGAAMSPEEMPAKEGQEAYQAVMKDRMAPGEPEPASAPLVNIEVEGGEVEAPEVETEAGMEDPAMVEAGPMQMIEGLSDADKAQLMGEEQPASLTGKVRRAMLMKQQQGQV